jgi:hypothetical protein
METRPIIPEKKRKAAGGTGVGVGSVAEKAISPIVI